MSTYRLLTGLDAGGVRYEAGDLISTLSGDVLARLLAQGALELVSSFPQPRTGYNGGSIEVNADGSIVLSPIGLATISGFADKGGQVHNLKAYGAKGDGQANEDGAIAAWKAALPATGARGVLPQGAYNVSTTVALPTQSELDGAPGSGYLSGDYSSGSALVWKGAAGGTILSFFGTLLTTARNIALDGSAVSGVVGALIDSNNSPISKYAELENFSISRCGVQDTDGYGVRVGVDVVKAYQADTWTLRRGFITKCRTGLSIWSYNSGYQGKVDTVTFSQCVKGIEVVQAGNFEIERCPFGGHNLNTIADIWEGTDGNGHGGNGSPCLIKTCQTEKNPSGTAWFLLVDSSCTPQTTQAYTLINNQITDLGILLLVARMLNLSGGNNFYNCNVEVAPGAIGTIINDHGSSFNGVNAREVTDLVTTAGSATVTSSAASLVPSVDTGKRLVARGAGSLGTAAPGIPLGAKVGTVVDSHTALLVYPDGTPALATATATGVGARFDYGFVVPAAANATVKQDRPYPTALPGQAGNIAVGASPFTYTARETLEAIYIAGGVVSGVERNGGQNMFSTTNVTVLLNPHETVTVTYSSAPTMTADRK